MEEYPNRSEKSSPPRSAALISLPSQDGSGFYTTYDHDLIDAARSILNTNEMLVLHTAIRKCSRKAKLGAENRIRLDTPAKSLPEFEMGAATDLKPLGKKPRKAALEKLLRLGVLRQRKLANGRAYRYRLIPRKIASLTGSKRDRVPNGTGTHTDPDRVPNGPGTGSQMDPCKRRFRNVAGGG